MSGGSGGPAFPVVIPADFEMADEGMDLRDWFAGQALNAVMANGNADYTNAKDIARDAYQLADAMLDARAKGTN